LFFEVLHKVTGRVGKLLQQSKSHQQLKVRRLQWSGRI